MNSREKEGRKKDQYKEGARGRGWMVGGECENGVLFELGKRGNTRLELQMSLHLECCGRTRESHSREQKREKTGRKLRKSTPRNETAARL